MENNWIYAPVGEELRVEMNDIQKEFLIKLSSIRTEEGETIYTINDKDFLILPKNNQ